jgi:hypothetical protein
MPKTHWRWCRGRQIRFYPKKMKMTPWYVLSTLLCKNSKCLNMYLITLKVFKL